MVADVPFGSTGAGCGGDSRAPTVAARGENRRDWTIPVVKQRPFPLVLLFSGSRDSAVALGQDGRRPCLVGLASSTGASCDDDSRDLTVASR